MSYISSSKTHYMRSAVCPIQYLAEQAGVRAGGEFFERLLDAWEKQGRGG